MELKFTLPLYLVYGLLVLVAAFDTLSNRKLPAMAISVLMAVPLVFLATFRAVGVGSDDAAYLEMLYQIPSVLDCKNLYCDYSYATFNIEFGFFMFLSVLAALGKNSAVLFGFSSLIAVTLNVRSIRYFSPYFALAVLVYFAHFYLAKELNAIRLGLASGLLFLAATYLDQQKYKVMTALIVAAMLVHVSSVFFIVPVGLYFVRPKRSLYLLLSVVLILISATIDFKSVLRQMAIFGFVGDKIELYLNADMYSYTLPFFDMVNIKNLLVIIAGLVCWKRMENRYQSFNLIFCIFYCAAFLRIVLGDFAILAGRGYASISMFEYVLIPMIAVHLCGRKLGFLIVAAYTFATLCLNLNSNSGWSGGSEVFFDFL
ncbi:EpsG family protein [Pseudomonas veronii]|uniref:EpsG family protein n=1 Tax=Pseudomonas veronii TaxID=76761 RepID=UPI0015A099D8|nr:EpsG family protein [Pseudomonas veronii]NWC61277.1 EpsG family protein [Pseudomonas veronii]